jgi:hypothetical protein
MSKTGELSQAIEELRNCGNALLGIADTLADLFSSGNEPKVQTVSADSKPAEKPLTLEQVRAVLADKSRAGFTAQIRELLRGHGADKLSAIDPAEYPALLQEAEGIGNG